MRVAILDDYQNAATESADWSEVAGRAQITVFTGHLSDTQGVIDRLVPFDAMCVMRERTPLPRATLKRRYFTREICRTFYGNMARSVADWMAAHGPAG